MHSQVYPKVSLLKDSKVYQVANGIFYHKSNPTQLKPVTLNLYCSTLSLEPKISRSSFSSKMYVMNLLKDHQSLKLMLMCDPLI